MLEDHEYVLRELKKTWLLCSFSKLSQKSNVFLVSYFIAESWTLTKSRRSDYCSALDVMDLWRPSEWVVMRSWSNFSRLATLGKVHHCSMFSLCVEDGSHCVLLKSHSRLREVLYFCRTPQLSREESSPCSDMSKSSLLEPEPWKLLCNPFKGDRCQWLCIFSVTEFL